MKRRGIAALTAALLICLCAACGAETPAKTSGSMSAAKSTEKQGVQAEADFTELLQTEGNEKAALALLKKSAPDLTAPKASELLLKLESYQMQQVNNGTLVDEKLANLLQTAAEPYQESALASPEKIQNAEVREAVTALRDRGYKIIVPEGMYQAILDYSAYRDLEDGLTPDIRAYVEIMAAESDARTVEDAGLLISPTEVYQRAAACEKLIKEWPESARIQQVKTLYAGYVDDWFYGQNNTPAFDYTTNRLNDDFLSSYRSAGNADSPAAAAAQKYLPVLEKNGYRLTGTVKAYRDTMVQNLKKN